VRWPAPEKLPDLGNSSPALRALMYVASLRTLVQYHHHHYKDDRGWQKRMIGTGRQRPNLGGCGQDWGNGATTRLSLIQTWFTDFYRAFFRLSVFLGFVCVPTARCTSYAYTAIHLPTSLSWRSCTSTAHPFYPSTIWGAPWINVTTYGWFGTVHTCGIPNTSPQSHCREFGDS
jgi:hypothetical protein